MSSQLLKVVDNNNIVDQQQVVILRDLCSFLSLLFEQMYSIALIQIKNHSFLISYKALLLAVKSFILQKLFRNIEVNWAKEIDVRNFITKLPTENKIKLIYELNEKYGLTLSIDLKTKAISCAILKKSTIHTYRTAIAYIIEVCSKIIQQISYKSQVLQVVESDQAEFQAAFEKLYKKVLSLSNEMIDI